MNSFLLYILKSTFCISLFYLGFRMLLRKDTFFRLNRVLLLSAVIFSAIIPAIQLPQFIQPTAQNEWIPAFQETLISQTFQSISEEAVPTVTTPTEQTKPVFKEEFTWLKLVQNAYLAGILISFLILIYGIISILALFRKARFMQMDGFRLLIIDHEVPPFSFGRFVIISQADCDAHQQTILAHEEAHIRLNHFFDLSVLETVKLFHWFNPTMYWLIRDLKEIHEFQADQYTLSKGIDATQYQILIIQKSVGPQRFALANSFNHCQIKKRITMMNKQKTSRARLWKVATFLPLLALLLMAFGKKGESANPKQNLLSSTNLSASQKYDLQSSETSFNSSEKKNTEVTKHSIVGKTMIGETILENETELNEINSTDLPENKNIDPNNDIKAEGTSSTNNTHSTEINIKIKEDLRVISGKVINSINGEPLAGVSILIKGKTVGTITDVNGSFKINLADTDPSLVFVMDGFEKSEIKATEKDGITVKLAPGKDYESVLLNKKNRMETWAKILNNIPKLPEGQEPVVIQDGYETMYPANHIADLYNSNIIRDVKYSPTTNLNLKQTDKAKNGVLLNNTTIPRLDSKYLYIVDGKDVYLNDQFIDVYVSPNKILSLISYAPKEALGKYGKKGKFGATEIITDKK